MCVGNVHHSFLPQNIYGLETAPPQRELLLKLVNPASLIQLYTILSLLDLVMGNTAASLSNKKNKHA